MNQSLMSHSMSHYKKTVSFSNDVSVNTDLTETEQIVKKIISEINANSLRDMGKVMNLLKENYSGKMDFGKAGTVAKELLSK